MIKSTSNAVRQTPHINGIPNNKFNAIAETLINLSQGHRRKMAYLIITPKVQMIQDMNNGHDMLGLIPTTSNA